MTTTTIGRWGRQVAVQAAAPYPVEHARPSQESRSLYGGRWVRQAPGSRRAWMWDLAGLDDDDVADIEQLFHDSVRGPLFWADPTAHVNMVRHDVAEPVAGTLGSDDVALTDAGEATVDGRTWDMVAGELSQDVPTVEGTVYRALLRSADSLSSLSVESLDSDRAVTGTVGVAVNLLANPSFETGDLTGWTDVSTGSGTATVVADANATDGDNVVELVDPNATDLAAVESDGTAASDTDTFTASVDCVAYSGETPSFLIIRAFDSGGAQLNQEFVQVTGVGSWSVTWSPPASTTEVRVLLQTQGSKTTTVRFDAVQLELGSEVTGFTSGLSGTGLLAAEWTAGTEPGVRVTADGTWSGLQMFDTDLHDGGWRPGRGVPQVKLEGLTQQLLWALASGDVRWRDLSVRLVEVDS